MTRALETSYNFFIQRAVTCTFTSSNSRHLLSLGGPFQLELENNQWTIAQVSVNFFTRLRIDDSLKEYSFSFFAALYDLRVKRGDRWFA